MANVLVRGTRAMNVEGAAGKDVNFKKFHLCHTTHYYTIRTPSWEALRSATCFGMVVTLRVLINVSVIKAEGVDRALQLFLAVIKKYSADCLGCLHVLYCVGNSGKLFLLRRK